MSLKIEDERPILVGVPRNGEAIRELGRELVAYDRIRQSSSELENDGVARRELTARTSDIRARLEDELRDALLNVQWANEELLTSANGQRRGQVLTLPQLASELADRVFCSSPKIFSELVNRDLPSSNSAKARKDLLYAMLRGKHQPRLGLVGYPAEAGLYANLLSASGIHRKSDEEEGTNGEQSKFNFFEPSRYHGLRGESFVALWNAATSLIVSTDQTIRLLDVYSLWQAPPYGVRTGVLPVLWLAFFLANQHRFAIYKDGMFTPELREVDLDEVLQAPERFDLKHVQVDVSRREILVGISAQMARIGHAVTTDPLQAARSLVALVYDLPGWTLRTATLSPKARAVRDTLYKASDPHKVLFVDLPVLFGDRPVSEYLAGLEEALRELVEVYPRMVNRVLTRTFETLDASISSVAEIDLLRNRAKTVIGISGNLQLEAFAGRLATISDTQTVIEGLLGLALNKPPRDWNDRDIDAALIQFAQWSLLFRQIEAVSAVQDRTPTRAAIAVVFGTGKNGKTVSESFDVSNSEDPDIDKVASKIMAHLKGVRREVFLAALARAGASLVEAAQQNKESVEV